MHQRSGKPVSLSPSLDSYKKPLNPWKKNHNYSYMRTDMDRQLDLLFQKGVLNEQIFELRKLQDERNPYFVFQLINIYLRDSEKCLKNIRGMLSYREFSDYKNLALLVDSFISCNLCIGAERVKELCLDLWAASGQNNRAGCLQALELLEPEFYYLKNILEEAIGMERQRLLKSRY